MTDKLSEDGEGSHLASETNRAKEHDGDGHPERSVTNLVAETSAE
jgi:hypothetical protein